jgi:CheY-like chemotaxis protein
MCPEYRFRDCGLNTNYAEHSARIAPALEWRTRKTFVPKRMCRFKPSTHAGNARGCRDGRSLRSGVDLAEALSSADIRANIVPKTSRPILIVEDDSHTRMGLVTLLQNDGFSVVAVTNGQEALDALESGLRPALMLIDLMLPEVSGWDLLKYLHEDFELRLIPTIVVTAAADERTPLITDYVLAKPVDVGRLLTLVRKLAV